jgi:hypothetical protein
MAIMNLLKGSYTNRLGATVGSTWKGLPVMRTYTKPTLTRTTAQIPIRETFGDMQKFVALFADALKTFSALNVRQKSLRNAITTLNKDQFEAGAFDQTTLLISRGGLLAPTVGTVSVNTAASTVTVPYTLSSTAPFTSRGVIVGVAVNTSQQMAGVATAAAATSGSVVIPVPAATGDNFAVYIYSLDYHGYRKIASRSVYASGVGARGGKSE